MSKFVLQIQDLQESGRDWNFEIPAAWLKSALTDSDLNAHSDDGPGRLSVHAQLSGADVLVQTGIEARVYAECSRCLGDVPLDVDVHVTSIFSPAHTRPTVDEDLELGDDELDRDYYSGTEIVLDELVREHVILEAPMQPLCSDACPGIEIPEHIKPPEDVFGKGSQKDSPFAVLGKLKTKLAKNEE